MSARIAALTTFVLPLVLLGGSATAQTPVPIGARYKGRVHMKVGDEVRAIARIGTTRRKAYVRWRWFSHAEDRLLDDVTSKYDTPFWPTYIANGPDRTLYVSGLDEEGRTVIESWTFAAPTTLAPVPGERLEPEIRPGTRSSVRTLYEAAAPGRTIAAQLACMTGTATPALLVRFFDSGDLYRLDVATRGLTLVASPTPPSMPGVLHVEALADPKIAAISAGTHRELGRVYMFASSSSVAGLIDPAYRMLVLVDADQDGELDESLRLDEAGWAALGLADSSGWE